ncbi:MAG: hypothetical protein ACXVII_42875 [Solirubrobacteraceae bacterium]
MAARVLAVAGRAPVGWFAGDAGVVEPEAPPHPATVTATSTTALE